MNNDELKKKIADIIYHTGCTGACCECDYSKHSDADTYCKAMLKASALIAAGIGDVKEAEIKLAEMIQCFTRMETLYKIKSEEVEIKKHRAEVAERAFDLMLKREKDMHCIHSFANCDKNCKLCWEGYFSKQKQGYFELAEKELSEERK